MTDWMGLDPDDRTAVFIDGANLYKTAKTLGFDIVSRLKQETRLLRASYYTAMQEDKEADYSPLRPLIDWLDYNGFTMVTKPAKEFTGQFCIDDIVLYEAGERDFDDFFGIPRNDEDRWSRLSTEIPVADDLSVVSGVGYSERDSTADDFDYDNWEVSLGVAYRF